MRTAVSLSRLLIPDLLYSKFGFLGFLGFLLFREMDDSRRPRPRKCHIIIRTAHHYCFVGEKTFMATASGEASAFIILSNR